jgi:hypothetical protein
MKGRKGWADEGGVRSPLFIKYPQQVQRGTRIEQIAGAIDLLPTLAGLAGIEYHTIKKLDGISFSSALKGKPMPGQDRLIFNHYGSRSSVRSQQYRLDQEGQLFDISSDIGQQNDISAEHPEVTAALSKALLQWHEEVLSELPAEGARSFVLGHPAARFTQLPARDGQAHGSIRRSNRSPNCSFYTNWISIDDSISWNVEVPADGDFKVTLYYTCPEGSEGSRVSLSFGDDVLHARIREAHDPPLEGMEYERVPRTNSYVKDFKPLEIGVMHLRKGQGELVLKAAEMPGDQVMDFRLLLFERLNSPEML